MRTAAKNGIKCQSSQVMLLLLWLVQPVVEHKTMMVRCKTHT